MTLNPLRLLLPSLAFAVLLLVPQPADAAKIRINGARVPGETLRYKRGDYLPLDMLAERFGFEYRRTQNQLVIVFGDGERQVVPLDSTRTTVRGVEVDFVRKVHIDRGREFVTAEFVEKVLGAQVEQPNGDIHVYNRLVSGKVAIVEGREALILTGT